MTLGNWLLYVPGDIDKKNLKISEFSQNEVPITGIAPNACNSKKNVETVDLEGIKYLCENCFQN